MNINETIKEFENSTAVKTVCPICGKPMDETYNGQQYCEACKEKLGEEK